MNYLKPPLTFKQQAELLISRGLCDVDKKTLEQYLKKVNYYRLSGYLFAFKEFNPKTGEERFRHGTSFLIIQKQYDFDRRLRLLLMSAIERIEIAFFRTRLVEKHTLAYGPFGYTVYQNYNQNFRQSEFLKLISEISQDEDRSYEEFINRYRRKYTSEKFLPFWMAAEIMSFGQLFTLYKNTDHGLKKRMAAELGVYPPVLDSWLHSLNYVRNSCAQHVRLWNRQLAIAPKLPNLQDNPNWHDPVTLNNRRIFSVLTVIHYILTKFGFGVDWKESLNTLINDYPELPTKLMGFPSNWTEFQIWKNE